MDEPDEQPTADIARRVLCMQSSVVSGHVGNSAAIFPLQLLGWDALPLNTVQLATHTGYPTIAGKKLTGDEMRALVHGLTENALLSSVEAALSGYMASADTLCAVSEAVLTARALTPSLFYVCDPVLGDRDAPDADGRLYVPADVVPAMIAHVRATSPDVLTPNAFEAEVLTGSAPITDVRTALNAADALHALGARTVVITSSFISGAQSGAAGAASAGTKSENILIIVSGPWADFADEIEADGVAPGHPALPCALRARSGGVPVRRQRLFPAGAPATAPYARFGIQVPRLSCAFTGTGDLLAALILSHACGARAAAKDAGGFATALEVAVGTAHAVCVRTFRKRAASLAVPGADAANKATVAAATELALIPSRFDILDPVVFDDMQAFSLAPS